MAATEISLNVKNNTSGTIEVSLMGNPADLTDNANATTEYRYDITALSFTSENNVAIEWKRSGASIFQTLVAPLQQLSVDGVIQALNTLGIGSFFTFTSGGNTYISNYDDTYVFGQLSVYNNSVPILNYSYSTPSVTGGGMQIDVNTVPTQIDANPAIASGSITVANGDSIDFTGSYVTAPSNFVMEVYDGGTLLFSTTNPTGGTATFNFTVLSGHVYTVYAYDQP